MYFKTERPIEIDSTTLQTFIESNDVVTEYADDGVTIFLWADTHRRMWNLSTRNTINAFESFPYGKNRRSSGNMFRRSLSRAVNEKCLSVPDMWKTVRKTFNPRFEYMFITCNDRRLILVEVYDTYRKVKVDRMNEHARIGDRFLCELPQKTGSERPSEIKTPGVIAYTKRDYTKRDYTKRKRDYTESIPNDNNDHKFFYCTGF